MPHTLTESELLIRLNGALSLDETLYCGQAFRWREEGAGQHRGVVSGRAVTVRTEGDFLYISGDNSPDAEGFWRHYFDLDTDYAAILSLMGNHAGLKAATDYAPGIRVLRQEAFEALICFIISQNNNIKRIGAIVERLCANFGGNLGGGDFSFPTPDRLAALSVEDLSLLQAGYRDRYILDAARRVADGRLNLAEVAALPLDSARAALMEITGVGRKVADCALLFGFYKTEVSPMDVWMKRAMASLLPGGWPDDIKPVAGIAQQYMFHYARTCPDALAVKE